MVRTKKWNYTAVNSEGHKISSVSVVTSSDGTKAQAYEKAWFKLFGKACYKIGIKLILENNNQ